MTIYQTEGIVLKKSDAGEADRRFLIFSKDYGKIECYAKGVRKIKAKLAGHLENFNHSHLMLSISKNLRCNLISALTLENFPKLKGDELKLRMAAQTAELFDKFLPWHHQESDFWQLLSSTFNRLNQADVSLAIPVYFSFKVEFLKLLGYFPPPEFLTVKAGLRDQFLDDYLKELAQM